MPFFHHQRLVLGMKQRRPRLAVDGALRSAGVVIPLLVAVVQEAVGRRAPDDLRYGVGERTVLEDGFAQLVVGAGMFGDVIAHDENAADSTVGTDDGLKDEIDEALLRLALGVPGKNHRHPSPDEGLAGGMDLIEQRAVVPVLHFAANVQKGLADHLVASNQPQVGAVGQFIYMARLAHHRHEAGGLFKQAVEPLRFGLARRFRQGFFSGFHQHAVQPGHRPIRTIDRNARETEAGLLVRATGVQKERGAFQADSLPGKGLVDQRLDVGAHFGPCLVQGPAQRRRMTSPQDFQAGVVVQQAQLRPPGHKHRRSGTQHETGNGLERLRPVNRMTKPRGGPVVAAHRSSRRAAIPQKAGEYF